MEFLQYFVFDKKGNDILEADVFRCADEKDLHELVDIMKDNFHKSGLFKDTQLLISWNDKVLFNSKEA